MMGVCGCKLGWAGPTCSSVAVRKRICDPTNRKDVPPACEWCRIGVNPPSNGCQNMGFCEVRSSVRRGNAEFAACVCQVIVFSSCSLPDLLLHKAGIVGVQCGLTSLARFGREDVIFFRWIFFAAFAVILCFAVTSLAVHLYFACSVKFTSVNGSKMGGALLISFSCICQMIRHAKNPLGLVDGYPDPGSLLLNKVFFFLIVYQTKKLKIN